jgi:hypothetical protein
MSMQKAGEVWERNYRRRKLVILAMVGAVSALAPVVIKMAGEGNVVFPSGAFGSVWHLPLVLRILVAAAFISLLGLGARWNWLVSDEVRRAHLLSFWAAIGFSVGLTFFGFILFGRAIPEAARLPLAFMLPVGMGLLFSIARWLRDGFVW